MANDLEEPLNDQDDINMLVNSTSNHAINTNNVATPNYADFINNVAATGLYPYRCCFTIKVKESSDFADKSWFGKLKYIKSVIMTIYSLFITAYLTIIVTLKDNKYDFLNLNPDYSFSEYYEVIWRLRYLNYFGLMQMLFLSRESDDNSPIMKLMHPKSRFNYAVQYGNVKDTFLNHIKFITKSLTITNLVVNILLLSSSAKHYSTTALILLGVQTLNDYFVASDFNTFEAKYKPNGICQSIKVRLIELVTNWFVIIFTVVFDILVIVFVALLLVVLLLCCFTCCCCGAVSIDNLSALFGE